MLKTAKRAALEAGKILLNHSERLEIRHKKKKDLVTNVDILAENKIVSIISEKFPEHNILTEESDFRDKKSKYTWFIDPLDGTHNYIYGLPFYGVSIALAKSREPIVAVIYSPQNNEMIYSERGKGSFLNRKKLKVSERTIESAMVLVGVRFHEDMSSIGTLERLIKKAFSIRMLAAAVTSFGFLAKGSADVYVANSLNPWDYAAGYLITKEAGGKVTNFDGKPLSMKKENIVVTNGKVHDDVLRIIK